MRDLAKQNLSRQKFSFKKNNFVSNPAFKFLAISAVVLIFLVLIKNITTNKSTQVGEIEGLSDASLNLNPVSLESSSLEISDTGIQIDSDSISLKAVSDLGGSGTARRTFGGGQFTLSVSATLPDPKGNKYQVWLTNGNAVKDAGFMSGSRTSWNVTFRDSKNYSSYSEIWVTQEITTEDDKPEVHRLEGNF